MNLALFLLLFQSPAGQLTPQQQIDLAPPGSVVILHDDGRYWPQRELRIDKPLTLISNGLRVRNLYLEGRGGEVVISGLKVVHRHWCFEDCTDTYEWAPHGRFEGSVVASGFDRLSFYDCQVDGQAQIEGADHVLLVGSSFVVGDFYALAAYGAAVTLIDSFVANEQLAYPGVYGARECVYDNPVNGLNLDGSVPGRRMEADLLLTGTSNLGDRLELNWRPFLPANGIALLYADFGAHSPTVTPHGALDYLSGRKRFLGLGQSLRVPVPRRSALVGMQVAFQAYDLGTRISRPAFALIRP